MSAFVCGYVFAIRRDAGTDPLEALSDVAPELGVVFRPVHGNLEFVHEILGHAAADLAAGGVPFLATARGHEDDVSEALIDVYDDLVGTTISVRDAVLLRVKPLSDTIAAGFAAGLLERIVVVTSYGSDITYERVFVRPEDLAQAIAAAYEREDWVPSLCAVVEQASGSTGRCA